MNPLERMVRAYVDAAFFADFNDENGEAITGYAYGDIGPESLLTMWLDCAAFLKANRVDIGSRYEDAGHDFWLTRNRHGCGFWETPDWPKEAGQRLTASAHTFSEGAHLYITDDINVVGFQS